MQRASSGIKRPTISNILYYDNSFPICRADLQVEAKKSYACNTEKEKTILSFCQNFHRQFVHLYRDRRPVLLSPPNEFKVEVKLYLVFHILLANYLSLVPDIYKA